MLPTSWGLLLPRGMDTSFPCWSAHGRKKVFQTGKGSWYSSSKEQQVQGLLLSSTDDRDYGPALNVSMQMSAQTIGSYRIWL